MSPAHADNTDHSRAYSRLTVACVCFAACASLWLCVLLTLRSGDTCFWVGGGTHAADALIEAWQALVEAAVAGNACRAGRMNTTSSCTGRPLYKHLWGQQGPRYPESALKFAAKMARLPILPPVQGAHV